MSQRREKSNPNGRGSYSRKRCLCHLLHASTHSPLLTGVLCFGFGLLQGNGEGWGRKKARGWAFSECCITFPGSSLFSKLCRAHPLIIYLIRLSHEVIYRSLTRKVPLWAWYLYNCHLENLEPWLKHQLTPPAVEVKSLSVTEMIWWIQSAQAKMSLWSPALNGGEGGMGERGRGESVAAWTFLLREGEWI